MTQTHLEINLQGTEFTAYDSYLIALVQQTQSQ